MLPKVRGFRDLVVWQKAMDLVVSIYQATEGFPSKEQFGLTTQIRRAAVSVASNIAEGQGRGSDGDFARFLSIAKGSLQELQTQLELSLRLTYLGQASYPKLLEDSDEIGRMINGLLKQINSA